MPKATERYKNFLYNYQFHSNSIGFRIESSKALEKFKNVQAFQLNQIGNGRFYFNQDRREILLLEYDLWSRFLTETENFFIDMLCDHKKPKFDIESVEMIIELANKTSDKIETIIFNDHKDFFDSMFTEIWGKLHKEVSAFILLELTKLIDKDFIVVFKRIADVIVESMQYTLIEIYELHSIKCKKDANEQICKRCSLSKTCDIHTPFLVINDYISTDAVLSRIDIYKEYFNISKVFIKNYTEHLISPSLIEKIEAKNITIDFKKTITEQ